MLKCDMVFNSSKSCWA